MGRVPCPCPFMCAGERVCVGGGSDGTEESRDGG